MRNAASFRIIDTWELHRVHFLFVSIIPQASRRVFDKFDTRLPGQEKEEESKKSERARERERIGEREREREPTACPTRN